MKDRPTERPLYLQRATQKNADIHPCTERIKRRDPRDRAVKIVHDLDRMAIVLGPTITDEPIRTFFPFFHGTRRLITDQN
jgi:hypothetical protein